MGSKMGRTIQIVFSVMALGMMGVFIWRWLAGEWTVVNWIMLIVAGLSCLLVFARFVYIFNFSYALCVALNAIVIGVLVPGPASWLLSAIALLYGLRLLWFTWQRTYSESYADKMVKIRLADDAMPMPAKISLWFFCLWLQTFHLMAIWFVAEAGAITPLVMGGAILMLAGTLVEAAADSQKQKAKLDNPDKLVTSGIFSRWRHPNYAGEVLFQLGLLLAGFSVVADISAALAILLSPAYIVILMVSECGRVDRLQEERWQDDSDYEAWRKRSFSLLPGY